MRKRLSILLLLCLLPGLSSPASASAEHAGGSEDAASALNLANNKEYTWSYDSASDSWTMSIVTDVLYPVIEDEQGVSVNVPGSYIIGVDTDGDGEVDVDAEHFTEEVNGRLVIDYEASVSSENGQIYTASTAPVILNTGAAGYGNSKNTLASSSYAAQGYINVSCGNRGKQDSFTDPDGNIVYTGDAPSCLVDQKNAARFVRYNILLGNLPGSMDTWVSTGGSGGGAHALMFAASSNNPDFYDYEIECGAAAIFRNEDGSYDTSVSIDGKRIEISDGAWGCMAYSAISSLYEADMALAFEYTLDPGYSFNTDFQRELAFCLSKEYMDYINGKGYTVNEADVCFDLDGDGEMNSEIALRIEYDREKYPDCNGFGGSYLDLYQAEFVSNLQWYVDSLDYAEGWTWFDEDGNALSDEETAAMTSTDKAKAFIEGRYTESSSAGHGGMDRMGQGPGRGEKPDGAPDGGPAALNGMGDMDKQAGGPAARNPDESGDEMLTGGPDAGSSQSSGSSVNSANYGSYEEMLSSYEADIAEIQAGDLYGKNIVNLYNPLNYIGAEGTRNPTWIRILCGASEGDISMFNSLNIQIEALMHGIHADIAWQWNGGHVPSEIFGDSLPLYVDEMVGQFVEGAAKIEKAAASPVKSNGDSEKPEGTDLSSFVQIDEEGKVSFTLADISACRTDSASKACPGFDVIDYGQEDYVFGSSTADARHWSEWVLKALKENQETLSGLFNVE